MPTSPMGKVEKLAVEAVEVGHLSAASSVVARSTLHRAGNCSESGTQRGSSGEKRRQAGKVWGEVALQREWDQGRPAK